MVSKFMHKSPAKMILFSVCASGMMLLPALAQSVVAPDGRVGTPLVAPPAASTAANVPTTPSPAPANSTSYVLGPEDQITVRVFAADDIPDKPAQIDNDGTVTFHMIG
jgi:polysaccharide export outer membrane protein